MAYVIIIASCALAVNLHIVSMLIVGRLLSIPVEEAGIFYGPTLATMPFRTFKLKVGMIPFGGFVKFDMDALEQRHLLTKSIVILSGCTGQFVVAAILLGVSQAADSVLSGFSQIPLGAWSPIRIGKPLVAKAIEFINSSSIPTGCGTVLAKQCAANLLPIPLLNGGDFLLRFFRPVVPAKSGIETVVLFLSLLLIFALYGLWIIALVSYLAS